MRTLLAITALAALSAALTPLAVSAMGRTPTRTEAAGTPAASRPGAPQAAPCLKPIRVVYAGYGEPVVCRDR
ncbi:hypothetical protein [Chelatococcus composti]|mgnify:CR=1 FL=1|jgi:hypothetical protein|uniref:Porin n=1 Tax=Chelatococcus composti TaxID=1743235 RepID=A0A841KEY7_9HYPH|nr:hypothetical protein [Chelatococcus composti]MBB6168496.1 hypothetical protein [Chelatococcus composti]MBS7736425.1 hypothetical protein [Chelatococcus composti]PZN40096.1 MAG: hypothetical protein DIU59_11890 [Pseudomonadota bacterium]GGG40516.1 hypothetical protein GCM10008026_21820 [Chelatococcus composti]